MKAIIPVAGKGTRMRPHTHTLPKALLHVAGKPILGHILDEIASLDIKEVILIIGYMGEKIKRYVNENYPDLTFYFAEQKEMMGLGHAVYQAKPFLDGEPALIIYGDTIFIGDIRKGKTKVDGSIGVKMVDDPRRFGVVEVRQGRIVRLIEKPDSRKPMPAIAGVNFINNTTMLFKVIEHIIEKGITTKDEYQLTDAFQVMVEQGAKLVTFDLDGWYDCGSPKTLLETNKYLMDIGRCKSNGTIDSVLIDPVYIEDGVVIERSIIGPYVSVAKNARIENSIIKNSIINNHAHVENALLRDSIIGENAIVRNMMDKLNVGDNSEITISDMD